MANRYANLVGSNKIKDEWQKINEGFDKVQQEMDEKPDASIAQVNDIQLGADDTLTLEGGTGITVTTVPGEKKVRFVATGESTPGPHAVEHITGGSDVIPNATTSASGLMSAEDKQSLEALKGLPQEVAELKAGLAINVKSYGAVGDGVTDDTNAINAAIQAASNAVLFLPPGTYVVSDTLVVDKVITITGAAPELTTITTTSTTKDIFVVNQWKVRIQNLSITSAVTRTGGYGINHQSGSNLSVTNVVMSKMYNGIKITGALATVDTVSIREFLNNGIEVSGGTDQKLLNIVMDNTTPPAGSGILVQDTGALFLDNCDIIRSNIDLQITPGTDQAVFAVYATNCYFDTATHGLLISGSSPVERVKFTNCWFSSHSSDGILLNNSAAKAIDFVNCDIYDNGSNGINAQFVDDWSVSLSRIAGNGDSGVSLSSSSKKFRIINNFISPTGGWSGNRFAIWINSGTYDHYEVRGNVVYGNITGTIVDSGSSTYKLIKDNVGYNPRGNIEAPPIPASGTAFTNTYGNDARVIITGGTVTSIKIGSAETGLTSGLFIVGPGETITLTYSVAPTWQWFVL